MRISSGLNKTLDSVRAMDCLKILDSHLDRLLSAVEVISGAPDNENTRSMSLRLQLSLNNYYHFLTRLSPEQNRLQTKLDDIRKRCAAYSRVIDGVKEIEAEFRNSRKQFEDHIAKLEGPSLLSWVHPIRYYISRAIKKADDLALWAEALTCVSNSRDTANRLGLLLTHGWPELTSQAWVIFGRLESEVAKRWWFGKGRRAKALSAQFERLLNTLNHVATGTVEAQMNATRLIEALLPKPDPRNKGLTQECEKMKSSPTRRLKYLAEEAAEVARSSRINGCITQVDETRKKRLSSRAPHSISRGDWLERLGAGHKGIISAHELAHSVLKVLPSVSPLIQSLKNEDQRRELILRRDSLLRAIIDANLLPLETTSSALEHVSWFAMRLSYSHGAKRFCTRFGEAIFPDDPIVQCPKDSTYCHPDCLIGGTCPVCGIPILLELLN